MKNLYIYILYVRNGIQKEFPRCVLSRRHSATDMLHIYRRIAIQKCDFSRVELALLHGCSPVNWLNVENLWLTTSVYMEVNTTDASQHSLV